MIEEGDRAPTFELPGVRDGEIEQVSLSEYLGDEIVILAFYPGDFNPACSDGTTDLDELDLFTMQKDVSILALSADSVFSHRAFADEFDLHIPLLSDAHGEVAAEYGVAVEDDNAGYLSRRAVVVVGPRSTVEYAWVADDVEELPDVDAVRDAIQSVGGDDTALARYRVGHAHYIEGRRAFTSAMSAFEEKEWMMAKGDFDRAYEEFDEAEDEFNTAARFAEDETSNAYFEQAERKAEALWRSAEWLSDSANAFASGEGAAAESMRQDAQTPLETARDIHEPPSPDDFPPDEPPPETDGESLHLGDGADTSLDLDVSGDESTDEMVAGEGAATPADGDSGSDDEPTPATSDATTGSGSETTASGDPSTSQAGESNPHTDGDSPTGTAGEGTTGSGGDDEPAAEEIDEAELEEIAAELEEQTEAAQQTEEREGLDREGVVPDSIDVDATREPSPEHRDDADGSVDGSGDSDERIDLDLTDPMEDDEGDTDGEDDVDSGDASGDHGVPDSL